MSVLGVSPHLSAAEWPSDIAHRDTIIADLDAAGYIDSSSPISVSKAREDLQYNYTKNEEREYEEIVPRTF